MNAEVRQIVARYGSMIIDQYIFFQPTIPARKLSGALEAFAPTVRPEEVLALIDNTMRGNAKDGAILTATHFYAHSVMEKPICIQLDSIESVSLKEGWTSKLLINGIPSFDINYPKKEAMRLFTTMLNQIVATFHAPPSVATPVAAPPAMQPEKSPVEALKELKGLLDAGIITEDEYRTKKEKYLNQL
jgi:hypothetical protein